MKVNYLLSLGAILTVSCQFFLNNAQSAIAVPASIFQPILQDIRTQLPKGMVMRLPAFIPDVGITPYATVNTYGLDQGIFMVELVSMPDCQATMCTMGYIKVYSRGNPLDENDKFPDRYTQPITLKLGIRGFYSYYRSGSLGDNHHVLWKQNGLFFEVVSRVMSKQQVIDMAISMATEPPIRSAR